MSSHVWGKNEAIWEAFYFALETWNTDHEPAFDKVPRGTTQDKERLHLTTQTPACRSLTRGNTMG